MGFFSVRTAATSLVTLAALCLPVLPANADAPREEPTAPGATVPKSLDLGDVLDVSELLSIQPLVIPKAGYGFADGMKLIMMSPTDLERQLEAVALTDAQWLRVPFNWSMIEATQGSYDWSRIDRVVDSARAHGLTVLANLAYAPEWARGNGTTSTGPPRRGRHYGAFAREAATHFDGRVEHFEVWNEPNLIRFFGGQRTHGHAPEKYTRLLKKAYRSIKSAQPSSTVVAGALAAAVDNDEAYAMSTFVRRMYAAGAKRFFDAIALHPYTTTSPASWNRVYGDVTEVRKLMRANKNGRRKIWYTEFGHTSPIGGLSQTVQALWVLKELTAAANRRYVGPAFLYAIRDAGSNRLEYSQNFGSLLTYDFQPKVLGTVLATVAALP